MPNKLPKFLDNHKICIICEGNEEYEYLNRLKNLKIWNEQYDISLVNAGGNGNIPARYQDRYQNGADELVLVFCDTEKKPHEQYEDIKRKIVWSDLYIIAVLNVAMEKKGKRFWKRLLKWTCGKSKEGSKHIKMGLFWIAISVIMTTGIVSYILSLIQQNSRIS